MKTILLKIQKSARLIGCLLLCSFQSAFSQNPFCEHMGDDRIETWVGYETSTSSKYAKVLKEGEFMFINHSKHPVSFYYNGINIRLAASELSAKFTGTPPKSLNDCRVIVDGIPMQNYLNDIDFIEKEYNHLPTKFAGDKTVQELRNDINVYNKTLARLQTIKNTMPAWFTKILGIDYRITQTKGWLETNNHSLTFATNAGKGSSLTSNSSSGISVVQNGSTQATTNNTNSSASSSANPNTESQRREAEVKRQLAQLEEQQKAKEASAAALSTSLQGVASMFAQGMAEDRARAEARDARYELIRQQNAVKGSALLNQYKADAERGDEAAIGKVIEAYSLLDYKGEQKSFMHAMMDKYNSPVATSALTAYYTSVMKNYKTTGNRYMRQGIGKLVLLSGAGVGLAYAGSEIDIYDEPERTSEADLLSYSGAGLMIVGILAGMKTMAKSGYKSKPEYVEAQQGLAGIQQRVKLSFSPRIDLKNSYGMSLRMTF